MCAFHGAGFMQRALILSLAMPTYIIAYTYVELLKYAGPFQTAPQGGSSAGQICTIRSFLKSARCAVLSSCCRSFSTHTVYSSARASFLSQSAAEIEVARTLGHTRSAPC